MGEEHLGLAAHRPAQLGVQLDPRPAAAVLPEHGPRVDRESLDVAHLEPLTDEIPGERLSARVLAHPLDLASQVFPAARHARPTANSSSSGMVDQRK